MLTTCRPATVRLLPGLFRERMLVNRAYLLELDSTCLLQNFYLEAGIILPGLQVVESPEEANLHWGWEAPICQLRGHFLGHWMSAAAQLAAAGAEPELKAKLDGVVAELARCQALNGGEWVGSIPEKYFDMLAKGQYVWSPQYVMHKTIMGLTDTCKYTGNAQALEVVGHLAGWYVRWVAEMQRRNPAAIFQGEQAGMLEAWAELYALTGEQKYLRLAEAYQDNQLFHQLDAGADALTDDHANASIPLAQGAARMYEITHEEIWRQRTETFWRLAVTERGMYCTTGSNSGEFWIPPHRHGTYMGSRTQEFCTVYNMVRVADALFRWTGERVYANYIEQALYNGFLAQQNRSTGMPAYFLPLAPGSRKKWGSRRRDFWCCHGTMVQAQAMVSGLIWYAEGDALTVGQYIPSEAELELNGAKVRIRQEISMKSYNSQMLFDEHSDGPTSRWSLKFTVSGDGQTEWALRLRVPAWAKSGFRLVLNGEELPDAPLSAGFVELRRAWAEDALLLQLEAPLRFSSLEDMPELSAVMEGPIVLAGLRDADCGLQGASPEDILAPQMEHTYETFLWQQSHYRTRHQPQNFTFVPLYDVQDEAYTVYFTVKGRE